ncbi:UNVERIFIED_CONTAM: Bromodomain-containing protein 9 [Sesamum angustifolium]|uniref:Bromodomain-containing protein 9 n=1 Tax=Sesamum angustifolium TaxID=2727405 RepID=A0AAW2PBS0_9LAMI
MAQILRKKKGRPPKVDPLAIETSVPEPDLRRSHRRRNVKYVFGLDDYFDDDELFENEELHRREKKLKHLLNLQSSGELESTSPQRRRTRRVDHAPATSANSSDDGGKPLKKRKIDEEIDEVMDVDNDDANDEDNYTVENDEEVRDKEAEPTAEHSPPGAPTEFPSGIPLPDKKALELELVLDKLQKKDIYGVYAEPVDPEELPDYHDVIKHPMDFATVRSKLGNGSYATLEQFEVSVCFLLCPFLWSKKGYHPESDVFLICSNAMQYNAPDTIYHKQARSIKELAIKEFHKIRLNAECSEKDVKPDQKMRSCSTLARQIKRSVSRTVQESLNSDFSSGATHATTVDIHNASDAFQSVGCERPGNIDVLAEGNHLSNDNNLYKGEESLPGKVPLSRFGRKPFLHDDNRRATYSTSLSCPATTSESMFSTFEGESKQLIPVGPFSDNSYARSLARFATTFGSVAWKVTSKRIEQVLPQGFKFGRGWVGDYEPRPTPVLMLENCTVKEPPFLAKVQPDADPWKFEDVPMVTESSKESPCSRPFLENKSPFIGPAGVNSPAPSITTTLPVKQHPITMGVAETKPSFFSSPGMSPSYSANPSNQHQNFHSRTSVETDEKALKQFESRGAPSFSKNAAELIGHRQVCKTSGMEASMLTEFTSRNINLFPSEASEWPDNNGPGTGGLPNGRVVGNGRDSNTLDSSSFGSAKSAHRQGQGLSDPVQLMRMLAGKAQNQQLSSDQSSIEAPSQVSSSAPSSSGNDLSIAAVAAARAWMSVGAGGFKPAGQNANLEKDQIYADSLCNSTCDIQQQVAQFHGEFPASRGMHVQSDRKSSPRHAFVPGPVPIRVGNGIQFHNQSMVSPQLISADSSRFQVQSTWRNLSPQMHSRQKLEAFPPDLNIGFQSSGSPRKPPSGVLVDPQQPDLALQL